MEKFSNESFSPTFEINPNLPEYDASQTHRLFVYGSLKRGFSNHCILYRAKFVNQTRTAKENLIMMDFGGIPGVSVGGQYGIFGEIYEISGTDLYNCDLLEANDFLYKRELINFEGEIEPAWIYLLKVDPSIAPYNFNGVRSIRRKGHENEKCLVWLGEYARMQVE